MNQLDVSLLPDLPQKQFLLEVLGEFWQDPTVVCLWLTGSLGRGAGDIYSDVDLGVAVQPAAFNAEMLPASAQLLKNRAVVHRMASVGEQATLHYLLLAHGELYDLMVQTTEHPMRKQHRLMLACRDEAFAAQLLGGEELAVQSQAADPAVIREAIVTFWMAQLRHQKVLYRDLRLVAWVGEQYMREGLIRLWYVLATGYDCGPLRQMTIHTLSPVVRAIQEALGDKAPMLIGQPLRTRQEILEATAHIRAEVAYVGRALAERLGFDYPSDVEAVVLRGWQQFLSR